ncbi:MAG TPA: hypothetical protein PLC15_12345 [Candidatus Obscuribacter sp.]|nr:hypothetical protein [Candidatus Obscuribacter sp.]HMW91420.1 hypothetical protein [Candidatus Obscuribacter sp.]HMY02072.1 hypothetical protein [Candidatus Obscuribacter sp.]HNA74466.1 hypothetical protein [Candidatus Obscuribacter sp.]HNB16166.1 hypothetical protein [Candidatus Obscuribacter sp.]
MVINPLVNQMRGSSRHLPAKRRAGGLSSDAGRKPARLFFACLFTLNLSCFCPLSLWQPLSPASFMESLTFCQPALAAPGIAENLLSGPDAAANNKQLTKSIDWLTSLPDAREKAAREGKLILWLHMLGNIDGFT